MINKFILSLLAVLLLGSCSNKFSLVKRKYNKGYYLDMSKNNSHKAHETEKALVLKTKKSTVSDQTAEPAKELSVSEIKSAPLIETKVAASVAKNNSAPKESKPLVASAKKAMVEITKIIKPVGEKDNTFKSGKGDIDGNTIVMIILCLFPFICLIPVYLHDGKKVTLNFWITLLLHLTFVGYIIFALLVVLDVVNLA